MPRSNDTGALLDAIASPRKSVVGSFDDFPDLTSETDERTVVILNGNMNYDYVWSAYGK